MILPYIALAATGLPAAYRQRAFRLAIVYQVVMTCGMKFLEMKAHVWWPGKHVYYPIWTVAEPVGVILFAVAVLKRCRLPWTSPLYGFLAFALYSLTLNQPRQWQAHPYLQPEINVVGLCWILLGLLVVHTSAYERAPRLLPLAALFLSTGAAYLAAAWGYEAIVESMSVQAGCYLLIAVVGDQPGVYSRR